MKSGLCLLFQILSISELNFMALLSWPIGKYGLLLLLCVIDEEWLL